MTERVETHRALRTVSTPMHAQVRPRILAKIYPLVITVALAILGHVLLGLVSNSDERLNVIGAGVFAILGLILLELRERSQTARLLSLLENARGDNWLISHLEQLVADHVEIMTSEDTLFSERAREHIVDVVGKMSDIAEGHIDIQPLQESVFTIKLVDKCDRALDAISIQDDEWWSSPLGHEYLERHKLLLKRGGRVRRVFVLPNDENKRRRLVSAMAAQRDLKIDVRSIAETKLRPEHRKDFVIYDDRYVRWGLTGEPRAAQLSRNPDDIAEARNIFDDAWLRARDGTDAVSAPEFSGDYL